MKIAVSATGGSMNAKVSDQFGRCAYFVIVDSINMKFEPVSNPGIGMMGGAGPEAARLISSRGANIVLTGGVGPNAERALQAAEIQAITDINSELTVREAVENYLEERKADNKEEK